MAWALVVPWSFSSFYHLVLVRIYLLEEAISFTQKGSDSSCSSSLSLEVVFHPQIELLGLPYRFKELRKYIHQSCFAGPIDLIYMLTYLKFSLPRGVEALCDVHRQCCTLSPSSLFIVSNVLWDTGPCYLLQPTALVYSKLWLGLFRVFVSNKLIFLSETYLSVICIAFL